VLLTPRLRLRPPSSTDLDPLAAILAEPAVARFWPAYDRARVQAELIEPDEDKTVLVVEAQGADVAGVVQFEVSSDPEYPHAGVDIFLATRWHGQGLGAEALSAVVAHLFGERGVHRIVIDPAADNVRAIQAYTRVGFRAIGLMRKYQRYPDGTLHDGLLMELLAEDAPSPARPAPPEQDPGAFSVRTAGEADVAFLVASMVDFNRHEGIAWDPGPGEMQLRRLLADPLLGRVVIACSGSERVGYAFVSYGYDLEFGGPDSFLTELYLLPAARGRGLGGRLLDAMLDDLRARGFGAIHLQVRPENVPAQRLYLGAGFQGTTRMFLSKRLA
jgi:aminoglycoside 6'-N-acetyltransferase